jgi:hypothetical protein
MAVGAPSIVGTRVKLAIRGGTDEGSFSCFWWSFQARMRALRNPSRLRNKIVLERSSNWIDAVPSARGDTKRRRAWLRVKVNKREHSWRPTSRDAEDAKDRAPVAMVAENVREQWMATGNKLIATAFCARRLSPTDHHLLQRPLAGVTVLFFSIHNMRFLVALAASAALAGRGRFTHAG